MIGKHSEVITGECNDARDEGRFTYTLLGGILYFEGSGKLSDDFDLYCFDDDDSAVDRYYDLLFAKKIVIGEGCTAIGYGMFDVNRGWTLNENFDWIQPHIPCEAESILIPQGVTEIGERAFAGCIHVKQLMIPDSVVAIGRDAFLDVPHIFYHGPAQSDDNWGAKCWNRDAWKQITNETGIFYIDDSGVLLRYEHTPQNDIYDDGCRSIGSLTIPEGIRKVSDNIFRGYDIGWVKLPASLKCLGENVFSGSHIGDIKLPENPDPDMLRQLAHRLRFVHVWTDHFIDRWPQEYQDIYMGKSEPKESWKYIYNDSGSFWIDSDGVLMDFSPNNWFKPRNDKSVLYELNIPEGVTAIPSEMFQEYVVHMQITFPKSLRCIGVGYGRGSAFRYSWLPDLVLPENLEVLGDYAFATTVIRSVTIPQDPEKILPLQARQFFGSDIGELRVPVKYRHALQGDSWKDGHEMTDPVFGQLYCAKHTYGHGAEVMAYLEAMHQLREEEME